MRPTRGSSSKIGMKQTSRGPNLSSFSKSSQALADPDDSVDISRNGVTDDVPYQGTPKPDGREGCCMKCTTGGGGYVRRAIASLLPHSPTTRRQCPRSRPLRSSGSGRTPNTQLGYRDLTGFKEQGVHSLDAYRQLKSQYRMSISTICRGK